MTAPQGVLFALDQKGTALSDPYTRAQEGWTWLHLSQKSAEARRWIREESGIPELEANALIEETTRPRCVRRASGILFIGRGVNLDPSSTPEDMVTVRAWVERGRIVTVVLRRLRSAEAVADEFETDHPPMSPNAVLSRLIRQMVDRMTPIVDELADKLDEIQTDVIDDDTPTIHASALSPIRLRTVSLHRYLIPFHDAAETLVESSSEEHHSVIAELHATRDRLGRVIEDLAAIDARAGVTRDEIVSRRSEELNDRVYVLTILAGVFLPLTVITGLLGMNVGGIPLMDNALGFWITTLTMITLLAFTLGVLRLKRWI